jgi:uncharacterized membrane protein
VCIEYSRAFAITPLVVVTYGGIELATVHRDHPNGTRAKNIGLYHALVNVGALILFALGLFLRWKTPTTPVTQAAICSFAGLALALVGGWFGGELVERLGVGVSPNANLNAPNSLTHEKAYEIDVRHQNLHPTR